MYSILEDGQDPSQNLAWIKSSVLTTQLGFLTSRPSQGELSQVAGADGRVRVDLHIAPEKWAAAEYEVRALGFEVSAVYGAVVSGSIPVSALRALDDTTAIQAAVFSSSLMQRGWVQSPEEAIKPPGDRIVSQGDAAIQAADARHKFALSGDGIEVGILSDSFASDQRSATIRDDQDKNELPQDTRVLLDDPDGEDEGRAMAQIIHDVAPGASILFHSASFGEASFARGIQELVRAGADILVDDVIYFREPMFMNGIISQSATEAVGRGAVYVTAAGNQAAQSYQAQFNALSMDIEIDGFAYDILHDFDPGSGEDFTQSVLLSRGESLTISLQWDQPYFSATGGVAGAQSDIDLFLLDDDGDVVASGIDGNIDGDPVEIVEFTNTTSNHNFELVIGLFEGPVPNLIKYVEFDGNMRVLEYDTASGTAVGHTAAPGVISTGAAFYQDTPEFGVDPALLREFSSNGEPVPQFFDDVGRRLAEPEVRQHVDIVGPEGVDNSFFGAEDLESNGLPNFSGTSAAAPHVAAAAALMLERNPSLWPEDVAELLTSTALDMNDPYTPGFDIGADPSTGSGLIDAEAAIELAAGVPRQTIAEFGHIEFVSHITQTIELDHSFIDPVVIAAPPGDNGSDPGAIRISSVSSNSFDIRFEEPNYQDGFHTTEPVSFLVVESGRHRLADGTIIEAGTLESNLLSPQGFERIEFSDIFDDAPVVLSQIQTSRGGDYAVTRMKDITGDGFAITMQEEEASNSGTHISERLGYVAVEKGVHAEHGIDFQAASKAGIGSEGGRLTFDDLFAGAEPLLFASIATFNGRNPATIRLDKLDGDGAEIFVEEERSADFETDHGHEVINFLIFDGPGRLIIENQDILTA